MNFMKLAFLCAFGTASVQAMQQNHPLLSDEAFNLYARCVHQNKPEKACLNHHVISLMLFNTPPEKNAYTKATQEIIAGEYLAYQKELTKRLAFAMAKMEQLRQNNASQAEVDAMLDETF